MNFWKDKTVIITGGTSGLGKCLVKKLIDSGAKVAFCGRSQEKLQNLQTELLSENAEENSAENSIDLSNLFYDTFDITREDKIINFVRNAVSKFGTVDVLINNAGVNSTRALVEDIKTEDIEYMMKVNMTAPLIFIKECCRIMKVKQEGLIVNMLSTCCLYSNEGIGAYTASKSALDGLTKVLRKEVRKSNIRVCSVYPGGINTPFRSQVRADYLSPEKTAEAILKALNIDEGIALDEIVLRPFIETNYC